LLVIGALLIFLINGISSSGEYQGFENRREEGVIRQTEERRDLENFQTVNFFGSGEIQIIEDEDEYILIEAEERSLRQIRTSVEDGVLEVRHEDWWWGLRLDSPKFLLAVRNLEEININGAVDVKADLIPGENLRIVNNGAGRVEIGTESNETEAVLNGAGLIKISGASEKLNVIISGLGEFQGKDLRTIAASVNISGAGKAELSVENELEVRISGAGNVDYWGNPNVTQNISGLGTINKR
jgi:hypothetical protein